MNLYHDLPLWNKDLTEINAVLEIPKWSKVKYEFDHKTWAIWVDRVWKTPITYTFNYWDLPQTWNHWDNDPLDVIILCTESLAVWTVVPCKVVGWLKMIDSWEDDYKILAVADDKFYWHIDDIEDIDERELEDIEYYMLHYKDYHGKMWNYKNEHWTKIKLNGWDKKEKAIEILKKCHEDYKIKFNK